MRCPIQVFNFSIKNSDSDTVDIHIDGEIVDASTQDLFKAWFGDETSVSFKSFRDQINSLSAKTYNIFINSPGGLVTDAMAMHDFLTELENKGKTVNRIGRGIVASAATYILMGPNSSLTKNSWVMIHNVSGAIWGNVDEVENYAATLRKFNNRSRDFYSEQTGLRKEDITKMMNSETWMTADEAKEKGFVKNVVGAANFTSSIKKENWNFSNTTVLNSYNSFVKPGQDNPGESITDKLDQMKKFFETLGTNIMNALKGVKAPENNDHAALMTSIGTAVSESFNQAADQFETAVGEVVNTTVASETVNQAISTQITNALKTVDFTKGDPKTAIDNAVTAAVANATKIEKDSPLQKAIAAEVKTATTGFENDITALKGGKITPQDDDAPKPIGKWVKG